MSPELKEKILTPYPDWLNKPLLLSDMELNKPLIVIKDFFEIYRLHDIRVCLEQWFTDVIQDSEVQAANHYYTYQHVLKLTEAAWIIHQKTISPKKKKSK